jgi:hypothetical protein
MSSVTSGPGVGTFGRLILNPQAMLAKASTRNAEISLVFIIKFSFWQIYALKGEMVAGDDPC